MADYVVATIKPWNISAFARHTPALAGGWHLIDQRRGLSADALAAIGPRYVFFPHWSWIVPAGITGAFECVCFHMTDVPYGRGGSPLQNLIQRGHKETMVSALRMVADVDAGPVYLKRPLSLEGSAQGIFERFAELVYDMAGEIAAGEPEPRPQEGTPTVFPRRTPDESMLPAEADVAKLYDHIRMLDAETYPPAFLDHGPFRLEFRDARQCGGRVDARVTIVPHRPEQLKSGKH